MVETIVNEIMSFLQNKVPEELVAPPPQTRFELSYKISDDEEEAPDEPHHEELFVLPKISTEQLVAIFKLHNDLFQILLKHLLLYLSRH